MARWNAVITDINNAIAEMNRAADAAHAAAEKARRVAESAQEIADAATTAADEAERTANEASALAQAWKNATVTAVTLEEWQEPYMRVEDQDGSKLLIIGIPKGETGEKGDNGEDGQSGVEFKLEGSILYITRTT